MTKDRVRIRFYETGDDSQVIFSIIPCTYQGQWIWAQNKGRVGLEIPGGHVEPGESPDAAARRELEEETGALDYRIWPVCYYSVSTREPDGSFSPERFGRLFYADIVSLGAIHSEIDHITLYDDLPARLTFPDIQPALLRRVKEWRKANKI